jgi:hypothetical protein
VGGLFEGFLHPALAAGALLAAVPILIHLLNRRRHRPLPWAGMRFVLAAHRRTRRRAQLENLLLLLLRAAAIVLIALAVARPFTGERSPLSMLTESRRDVVLVLDASASTGYRREVDTVFDRIRTRAREHLVRLDGSRGDRVRLVLGREGAQLLALRSPEDALEVLPTLADPAPAPLDLAAVLAEVADLAEEESAGTGESRLEVRLLTDLQRGTFAPAPAPSAIAGDEEEAGDAPAPEDLAAALDRLAELGVRVHVEDLGAGELEPPNLSVVQVAPEGEVSGPGVPVEVAVLVANRGARPAAGVRVALAVDGVRQPVRTIEIPPRGTARASFTVTFPRADAISLEASLEGDRLEFDDHRSAIVRVPPPVRVLVVNGAPAAQIDRDETGFLLAVLEPFDDGPERPLTDLSPFRTRSVEPHRLGTPDVDLSAFDVVVLANVPGLPRSTAEELERAVAAGLALVITLGDQVDAALYNERLWSADGTGLLPGRIGQRMAVASRRDSWYRVKSFDQEHPALEFFADERWRPLLTEVPVYEFLSVRPGEGARVLASLDDEAGSPLLVERPWARGRVLLWTTSIDPAWTRLPESPATLVPLAHELLRHAARPIEPPREVPLHAPLLAEVSGYPRGLSVLAPDGSRRALDAEPTELGAGRWALPPVTGTDMPGTWRIERDGGPALAFAVQADVSEGDLARVSPEELEALHSAWSVADATPEEGGAPEDGGAARGELWRGLALACLALLVIESLWAAWIGWGRRRVA